LLDNKFRNPNDETLTIRDHMDPDKHWIGETLPSPTQGDVAATVGATSGPGDSPFPARADHMHKLGTAVVGSANIAPEVLTVRAIRGPWLTLADDEAAYLEWASAAIVYGTFVLGNNTGAGPHGIFNYRVGDGASSYCVAIATSGSIVITAGTAATGLTGTTGVDGQCTLRAYLVGSPTPGRLYLENRSGTQRAFGISIINQNNATIAPGAAWTIV
jgi:hypothetical protein